jgi:DNA primase
LDEEVVFYYEQVWRNEQSRAFLEARGLTHSTVGRFHLGYVGERAAVTPERVGGHPTTGSLTIPYEDGMGRYRQLRYRPLYQSEAKYLTMPGEKSHLFAVRATDNEVCYVAEGEMDAMTLWQIGLRAVGIPGANNWNPSWRWLFRNCVKVVLCLDPDPSGIRAASMIYQGLALVTDVDVAKLPPKQDVNDVFNRYGERALREMVGA